jgi:hypothetical protein
MSLDPNTVTAIGVCFTALAGVVAAVYGYKNHSIATTIQVNTDGNLARLMGELVTLREANAAALVLAQKNVAES